MVEFVRVFKALANEHRFMIFTLLREKCCLVEAEESLPDHLPANCLSVNDIVSRLQITQATVSHHLKELANAGLLVRRKVGQSVYYLIDTTAVEEVGTFFTTQPLEEKNHV